VVLIVLALGWFAGLVPVAAWSAPWWIGAAWVVAALPALALSGVRARWKLAATVIVMALFGGWRLDHALDPAPPAVAAFTGQEATVTGTVVSEPDPGAVSTSYELRIDELAVNGTVVRDAGVVRVTLHQYASFLPGDRLRLTGEIDIPPVFDGFDYRSYLRQRGIWATMLFPRFELAGAGDRSITREIVRARLALDRSLQRSLPEPEASLAAGIAFGRDGNLSRESKEAFNRSGLRHLVAVSGSNVSLVAAVTLALAIPLIGRRDAWIPAALTIGVYLLAAGFSPSVVRAGVMAGIYLLGGIAGRPQSGLPALGAAFILMTFVEPANTLDVGFQLSMAATAGLLTVAPWLSHAFELSALKSRVPVPRWVTQVSALSVAASLSTAPIMWASFGELSLVSPVANLVVEPVFVVAFWTSLIAAVLGAWSEQLGWLAGITAYFPLAFIDGVAAAAASLPFASISPGRGSAAAAFAVSAPLLLAGALAYRYVPPVIQAPPRTERRRRLANRLLLAGAGGCIGIAAIPLTFLPARGPGELVVEFLDVGQGDAILVTTPHGRQVLVDGGPSGVRLARELGEVLPHWDRSLDVVVLTHPQEDHMGGLPGIAKRMTVATVYTSGHTNGTLTFAAFEDRFAPPKVLAAGGRFAIDEVMFEVLWPPPGLEPRQLNDASVVLRVSYGSVAFLLTGDIEAAAQRELLSSADVDAAILKVPHHGSKTSAPEFLSGVRPAVAVIQVGAANRFGHPHAEALEALASSRVYRTDQRGRVTVSTDGRSITVATER
jgi:competence protein ComEC